MATDRWFVKLFGRPTIIPRAQASLCAPPHSGGDASSLWWHSAGRRHPPLRLPIPPPKTSHAANPVSSGSGPSARPRRPAGPPALHAQSTAVAASPRLPEIGEDTSLEALTRPDRFAWPARFTCRPRAGRPEALVVVGANFEELNRTLAAADILLEDCRGGFALESVTPQDGKLERVVGEAAGDDI